MARGFATICWACHILFFSLDWVCFPIYCLGLMLGFGQWACSVTFFFFGLKVEQINLFIYLFESVLDFA